MRREPQKQMVNYLLRIVEKLSVTMLLMSQYQWNGKSITWMALLIMGITSTLVLEGVTAQPVVNDGEKFQYVDIDKNATLKCVFPDLDLLRWRKSIADEDDVDKSSILLDYTPSTGVRYIGGTSDHHVLVEEDPQYLLTIVGFTEADKGRYWCQVFKSGYTDDSVKVGTLVSVGDAGTSLTFSRGTQTLKQNGTLDLKSGEVANFTCEVRQVRPQAKFKWMLDGGEVTSEAEEDPKNETLDDLYNSRSTYSLAVKDGQEKLECRLNPPHDETTPLQINLNVEGAESSSLTTGEKVGIGIGAAAAVAITVVVVYFIGKKIK